MLTASTRFQLVLNPHFTMRASVLIVTISALLAGSCAAAPGLASTDIVARTVSPDNTCGLQNAGLNHGYTCPSSLPCCGEFGFCGSGDSYCLTSTGCQPGYSYVAGACVPPIDGQTISPDNTCGKVGAGIYGYRCNPSNTRCCSQL